MKILKNVFAEEKERLQNYAAKLGDLKRTADAERDRTRRQSYENEYNFRKKEYDSWKADYEKRRKQFEARKAKIRFRTGKLQLQQQCRQFIEKLHHHPGGQL